MMPIKRTVHTSQLLIQVVDVTLKFQSKSKTLLMWLKKHRKTFYVRNIVKRATPTI